MFTEDKLAAAQIAQIFGSELLKVQTNAVTDSGNRPNIVNIHPKQFLVSDNPQGAASQRKTHNEKRVLESLQREAEMAHPLPSPSAPTQTQAYRETPPVVSGLQQETLEKIELHLEKLVSLVETFLKPPKVKK